MLGRNYVENGELTGAGSGKVIASSRAQVASERSASGSRDEFASENLSHKVSG